MLNGDEQTCFVICIKYIHTNIKSVSMVTMNSCEIMFSRGSGLAGRSLETMHFAVLIYMVWVLSIESNIRKRKVSKLVVMARWNQRFIVN